MHQYSLFVQKKLLFINIKYESNKYWRIILFGHILILRNYGRKLLNILQLFLLSDFSNKNHYGNMAENLMRSSKE